MFKNFQSAKNKTFYTPVVEQFGAKDFAKKRTWEFINYDQVWRKFYSSLESLFKMEKNHFTNPQLIMSCYEVSLTEQQAKGLESVPMFQNCKMGDFFLMKKKLYVSINLLMEK